MKYHVIDLKEITENLGDHYSAREIELYLGQCPECLEENKLTMVSQREDRCPVCNTVIIWVGSKLWNSIYGSSTQRIRQMRAIPATTQSGKHLMRAAGIDGWRSKADADTWQKAVKQFGELQMTRVANYVTKDKAGTPAIIHAVATANKKLAGTVQPKDQEERQEIGPDDLKIVTETTW